MNDNVMDGAAFAQLLSNGNGNQWNNPFIYLIWMMFANQYMGGGNNANLQGLIQDNHNSDLLMSAVNGNLTNTVSNGFTQLGFSMQTEACNTRAASVANTQKIIDTLNSYWQLEQQTIGRLNQNQYLVSQLKTTA